MTIKHKLVIVTSVIITVFLALAIVIHCGYNYITAKASLANDFDNQALSLQMMLTGLNEAIINDGTPSSLRTEREGMKSFDETHTRLMEQVKDPDIQRIMIEEIDPVWHSIKKEMKPFLQHYVDLNDDELMIKAGTLIVKTEQIIDRVREFSERTRAIVNKNSSKSAIVMKAIKFTFIPILLLSVILAYHIYRSITRPIGEATAALEGLNHGDLSVTMDESRKDEFGSLARQFNKSIENLNQMSRQMQKRTDEIIESNIELQEEITERMQAQELIKTQLGRMSALRAIDKAILGSLNISVVLDIFIHQVMSQLKIDAASILLLNPKTQILEYVSNKGFHSKALKYTKLQLGQSNAGRAATERHIISIPNLRESRDGFENSKYFEQENFVSYFAVPLVAKGVVKGVLELFHRTQLDADLDWLEFLEAIADQGAIAIDNSTMFDELQRSNFDLSKAYDNTIEGWSKAMDMRDKETEGHSQRVTDMTVRIAHEMGIKDEDLVHIRRGALLHDMGKLGIPDSILLKPGKLTDEEWIIMKKHPEYAFEMLYPIEHLRPALDIPYYHHEKWDGTGYPKGLKGEEIPIAARIFAVVDVWDALRSDRPYRPAWPEEKVAEHIRSLSGTHFAPEVVEVLLKLKLEIDSDEFKIADHKPTVIT